MASFDCVCEYCKKTFQVKHKCRIRRFCSKRCASSGENSPSWAGDKVGKVQVHAWIKRHFNKPDKCDNCGSKTKLDLANKSNLYKRDINDWAWLCRKCHMKSDGRLEAFLSHSDKRRLPNMKCKQCDIEFRPRSVKTLFCSNSCKMTFFNLNTKKYNK